ncbi:MULTISPECIES: GFA family protein [unclassified Novosphingobium]|uniref:GFA family protein n=1 Tax=unclassified Novosphingobium TaxID=2644732 RepID=UPI001804F042|nr:MULTISPECIES: GFA family protein [unclassified Novosphingobium]NMN03945.1 hypothetical protein [Novosphingobium sp. SG919]NMN86065.1 hypothetical protein [Novosphingobium sp. SG916]
MAFTGRCACGAVTATISAQEPVAVRQCWCRQCQQAAAGGSTNNAVFPAESVTVSGALGSFGYVAPSGNTLTQFFCPQCGTGVMAQSSGRMHLRTVRLGFLDPGHGLEPDTVIWTDEAPAWAQVDQRAASYSGQPPAPGQPVAEQA